MRIVNFYIRHTEGLKNNPTNRVYATFLFYVSEIIMMIALCHSINKALKNLEDNNKSISSYISSNNDGPGGIFTDMEGNSLYL